MSKMPSARKAMIDSQLRPNMVSDPEVLIAFARVPREDHVPEAARAFAYFDRAIPADNGRFIMPPTPLGRLLSELAPRAGERALIYAPASSYVAALLGEIGLEVETAEAGSVPPKDRYDLVIVDGALPHLPDGLDAALKDGGRIGLALFERGLTRLVVGTRIDGALSRRTIDDMDVPLIPGMAEPPVFTF